MTQNLGNLFIDGELTIEDETGTHTITNNGVSVNTSIKQFGTGSLYFDHLSDLTLPATSAFQFNLEDFTIDFWINFIDGENGNSHLIEQNDATTRWQFWRDGTVWRFYTTGIDITIADTISSGVWYHMALVRHNGIFRIYRDGNLLKEETSEITTPMPAFLGTLYIGSYKSGDRYLNGYLDNIRITKGEALWTEVFELDELSLLYKGYANPNRPNNMSELFNIKQTTMRGKAIEGFVRPTIGQFFTSKDFTEILNVWPTDLLDSPYLDDPAVDGFIKANTVNHTYTAWNGDQNLYRLAWEDFGRYLENGAGSINGTQWAQIDFGVGKRIRKVGLAGWDSTSYPAYLMPKTFLITGSNDETNWTTLLDGSTLDIRPPMMSWQYMNLDPTGTYRYYRLIFTTTQYADGVWCSMGNWKLFDR